MMTRSEVKIWRKMMTREFMVELTIQDQVRSQVVAFIGSERELEVKVRRSFNKKIRHYNHRPTIKVFLVTNKVSK